MVLRDQPTTQTRFRDAVSRQCLQVPLVLAGLSWRDGLPVLGRHLQYRTRAMRDIAVPFRGRKKSRVTEAIAGPDLDRGPQRHRLPNVECGVRSVLLHCQLYALDRGADRLVP